MAMKCCTKLQTAKERCPIFFQGHPSNFKVTRYKTWPILTQIGRFRTIGQSQLSNPSDLPCFLCFIRVSCEELWKYSYSISNGVFGLQMKGSFVEIPNPMEYNYIEYCLGRLSSWSWIVTTIYSVFFLLSVICEGPLLAWCLQFGGLTCTMRFFWKSDKNM